MNRTDHVSKRADQANFRNQSKTYTLWHRNLNCLIIIPFYKTFGPLITIEVSFRHQKSISDGHRT